ncbi:hypothetical protein [Flavobacterium sp. S87F.05.LMB.W.Kidney.N]|uniref:hypothetical protein n=1 Tax=Flavobacterium sp. S87F.05.LMB.W.Kidney.N TaxID=1278758 RepID=UPI00106551C7|nr:hypothetical protein [Flavobacterium sp. S87F.05.LMB.W.Kidney.N]TDX12514.1 hypothetical protein EDB96_1581 [Flavobacterium sp. S87F.05.LMB.W.Kidney.N]
MKLKIITFIITACFCGISFSQENAVKNPETTFSQKESFLDTVIEPLKKNPLYFEKVFLHTNKTSYFIDDIVWFKAYVGDISNKPSLKTTRLNVNLLDVKGKIIQNQQVFIYKGIGKGQFILNDSLKTGVYYLEAATNYMRNFGDDNTFIQEINILNNISVKQTSSKNKYDIQFFPEGGYLLENVENTIGIKSLCNGKGIDYLGKIINTKNKEVATFKSQHLGMTRCNFIYEPNETYSAVVHINDTLIKVNLPAAQRTGILLNLDNTSPEYIKLSLKTNSNSIPEIKKNRYKLLFHQKNNILDYLEIQNLEALNLEIDKKNFYNGINKITLFKDNQPIAERKFYVEKEVQPIVAIEKTTVENDSINYKLKISHLDQSINANLSTSVLPLNALNYTENNTIKSAFLLSPYVKGYIENPAYYFNTKNDNRNQHLDLLLLTQGWTQFTLKEMIADLNPVYKYDFEAGFKLKGSLSTLPANHLALLTTDNIIIDKIFLNGKKDFSFNNLLIYKGDAVKISFVNNNNEAIKPENIQLNNLKNSSLTNLNIENRIKQTSILNENSWNEMYTAGSIKLDEIRITAQNKRAVDRKKLIKKYQPLVFDIGKYYDIEIAEHFKNKDLMYFLNFDQNVKMVTWKGQETYLETGIDKEAVLYIDGKYISSNELLGVSLEIKDIENIMIQTVKGNKIFQVFTTQNYQNNIVELFNQYIITDGFDKDKKYYSPIYTFNTEKYSNWTEIDWKPDLQTNNGEVSFKIKSNPQLEGYLFSVQGFAQDGSLISENFKINQ